MTVKLKKQFYINGEWIDPKKTNDLEVIDPSTEEVCAIISLGSEEDTNLAVDVAKKSFTSWWHTSKEKKLELLNNLLQIQKILLLLTLVHYTHNKPMRVF